MKSFELKKKHDAVRAEGPAGAQVQPPDGAGAGAMPDADCPGEPLGPVPEEGVPDREHLRQVFARSRWCLKCQKFYLVECC